MQNEMNCSLPFLTYNIQNKTHLMCKDTEAFESMHITYVSDIVLKGCVIPREQSDTSHALLNLIKDFRCMYLNGIYAIENTWHQHFLMKLMGQIQ